ncbi:MAG: DUF2807 domain-containing protein [Bacteroidales bacterium]|nr:DUF2807 domain-containing protein [Bacteroidales bacterium]MCF8343625.1 DUF2807 domain-containing protein [Bacteroidales bacterium]MCF8350111.1 DUF2807 domain-containing protein [Bacteroidales bacterium]MCF8376169.1 DUF2807 domain-containing protein [Bacteroidales bacterium]
MFTEERKTEEFNAIHLKGIGNLILKQADHCSLKLSSDKDVLSNIRTRVRKGELIISMGSGIPLWLANFPKIEIEVGMKDIVSIKVGGVGRISGQGEIRAGDIMIYNKGVGGILLSLQANEVKTFLKGVGEIELFGKTRLHDAEITGTGKINAKDLEAEYVNVLANGVGECLVHATKELKVNAGGIGRVRYRGNPKVERQQSGLGSIEPIP